MAHLIWIAVWHNYDNRRFSNSYICYILFPGILFRMRSVASSWAKSYILIISKTGKALAALLISLDFRLFVFVWSTEKNSASTNIVRAHSTMAPNLASRQLGKLQITPWQASERTAFYSRSVDFAHFGLFFNCRAMVLKYPDQRQDWSDFISIKNFVS